MIGGPAGAPGSPYQGEAIEARLVDEASAPAPLRASRASPTRSARAARDGRIVVQFVVDTLGRAEMSEFKVVDATDAQLAERCARCCRRFRFTPGEAGGRKVRTLVALPFDFTLVR